MAAVAVVPSSRLDSFLNQPVHHDIEDDPLQVWDRGVFLNELQRVGLALKTNADGSVSNHLATTSSSLKTGTYKGTQMAMTEIYRFAEEAAASHYDTVGIEPIIPEKRPLDVKKSFYQWSDPTKDPYPPHINALPFEEQADDPTKGRIGTRVGAIFDYGLSAKISFVATSFLFLIPDSLKGPGPYVGPTLADCEKFNRDNPSPNTDIMKGENIGMHEDWFSDDRFAQQQLSGANPCTITKAEKKWIDVYQAEADKQGLTEMAKLLSEGEDLFIQDYSTFRASLGLKNNDPLVSVIPELVVTIDPVTKQPIFTPTGKFVKRYGCAAVAIFQLNKSGKLHPLAITIDHKISLEDSVTIFNKRLHPGDVSLVDEKDDWPWRFAKTCAQSSDWARHEIQVHLTDTHMIEEAIIVATNRTIPEMHLLYEILSPHWYRTLALNAGARQTLVPAVINRLAGFGGGPKPEDSNVYKLIQSCFKSFDFQGKYIPNDLKNRGFPVGDELETEQYRNYPYARNMFLLWHTIRQFVATVLSLKYKSDADVAKDPYIPDWCNEIQTAGKVTTFPTITTLDQLVDAVTMCIHIASPQHTAVNYLQDYYYSWVPSKPPALCTPLPGDLKTLESYTEKELTNALPIGTEDSKWKDWLLAAQMPELLSYKVAAQYNLITYAKSLYNVNKGRTIKENELFDYVALKDAAALFYDKLLCLGKIFQENSDQQTPGTIPYIVMQPDTTAVSILI